MPIFTKEQLDSGEAEKWYKLLGYPDSEPIPQDNSISAKSLRKLLEKEIQNNHS